MSDTATTAPQQYPDLPAGMLRQTLIEDQCRFHAVQRLLKEQEPQQ
jgi:hypothetical protein